MAEEIGVVRFNSDAVGKSFPLLHDSHIQDGTL